MVGALGAVGGAGSVAGVFWYYGRDLPDIRDARDYRPVETSRVYARSGEVVAVFPGPDNVHRTVLDFAQIPEVMRLAMLAAEDAEFYEHPGIDAIGLLRAVYTNLRRGSLSQGASTITQQLVKNLVLSPERSVRRKVQEALLAFRLEAHLSKDEILAIYLNEIFFGVSSYGVEEASRYYFGHPATELSLPEAALLAGIVQSPNRYNPFRHPERALERRAYVLRQMWQKGFIEEGAYRDADAAPLELVDPAARDPWLGTADWFVDAVRRELVARFGADVVFGGGLQVHTTLDLAAQQAAQQALRSALMAHDERHGWLRPLRTVGEGAREAWSGRGADDIARLGLVAGQRYEALLVRSDSETTRVRVGTTELSLNREPEARFGVAEERGWADALPVGAVFTVEATRNVAPGELGSADLDAVSMLAPVQGAAVVLDPGTREVLALVGGFDFEHSPFNRAIQARRQVGSTFKPFVYAEALARRVATPATVYLDQPVTFPMPGGRTWSPQNYDGRYDGPLSLRTALARSRNVIAVRVLDQVGVGPVADLAARVGVGDAVPDNLTLALGSLEATPLGLAGAFSVFPAGGTWNAPVLIARVENARGEVLWVPEVAEPTQALDADAAWLATSMQRTVVDAGTGGRARALGQPIAGKTGTTNDVRDAWFVGFTPDLLTAVWIGRDDNETLGRGEGGGASAVPPFVDTMRPLLERRPAVEFPPAPAGVVTVRIDPATGLLARPGQPDAIDEHFLRGTEPRTVAPSATDRDVTDVLQRPSAGSGEGAVDDDRFDGF